MKSFFGNSAPKPIQSSSSESQSRYTKPAFFSIWDNKQPKPVKYFFVRKLGEGTYGRVELWECSKTGAKKAIKIFNPVQHEDRINGIPSTTQREIEAIRNLTHPNIVKCEYIEFCDDSSIKLHLEYYPYDLAKYIRQFPKGMPESKIKHILKQIMEGVAHIHKNRIIHRDLKPANILVRPPQDINKDEEVIAITDFGLSRTTSLFPKILTNEIETNRYRPPEILLGANEYDEQVDIWTVGLITYEMLTGTTFLHEKCDIGCLWELFHIFGTPQDDWMKKYPCYSTKFPRFKPPKEKEHKIGNCSPELQDLLFGMLELNPAKRMDFLQVMSHKYLNLEVKF